MKRRISLLFCLVTLVLAGCGTAASSDEPENDSALRETQTESSESETVPQEEPSGSEPLCI